MAWTELPENVFEAVMKHLQGDKKVSAILRHVCHAWREARDRLVTVLKLYGARPDVRVWKRFEGVKTLDLSQSRLAFSMSQSRLANLEPISSQSR
jgi:hypothetical protein